MFSISQGQTAIGRDNTTSSANITRERQERIIRNGDIRTPDIRKGPFDQHETWSATEAGEEATDDQCGEALRCSCTDGEDCPERDADEVDGSTAKSLAQMWCVDWREGNADEVEGEAEDGDGH